MAKMTCVRNSSILLCKESSPAWRRCDDTEFVMCSSWSCDLRVAKERDQNNYGTRRIYQTDSVAATQRSPNSTCIRAECTSAKDILRNENLAKGMKFNQEITNANSLKMQCDSNGRYERRMEKKTDERKTVGWTTSQCMCDGRMYVLRAASPERNLCRKG